MIFSEFLLNAFMVKHAACLYDFFASWHHDLSYFPFVAWSCVMSEEKHFSTFQ